MSEFGGAVGGQDRVNSGVHSKAMIKQVWRFNLRPTLSELRDALAGRDRGSLEMHWESQIE
jgi:hypothetical protein